MEEQHRSKRPKANASQLTESSSSRDTVAEPGTSDNPSGIGHAPLVLPDAAQALLESEAAAGVEPLLRNIHNGELPAELEMESNMPLPIQPTAAAGAAGGSDVEAPTAAETVTDTLLQRDLGPGAEPEQGEGPTDQVSIEIAHSSQEGTSIAITEGTVRCTDEKTAGNDMNLSKSPSIAGEEAQADRADGMNCPICMEPWTGEGIHRICCLACGHLFGRSCIRRWLNQRGKKNAKCPHCNRKARIEDIRNLYIPSLTVIDDKNQQMLEELGVMKSKNQELIMQHEKLRKEYERLQSVLAASYSWDMSRSKGNMSRSKENFFTKRSLNTPQECSRREPYPPGNQASGIDVHKLHKATTSNGKDSIGQFQLQEEFSLPGARVFDMDAYSQMLLVAQKSTAVGGAFNLNKISLLSLSDTMLMPLPQCTGAVRDIRVAPPCGKLPGRLALVASLGKMVSLFSLESNNVVLTYKLQSPCWSCAWDPNEPNYVFAGLQDGGLTVFDLRQTSSPLRSLQSFSRQPVHTLQPINECNLPQGIRRNGILSACSSGVCFWDLPMPAGLHDSRPHAVASSDTPGICIALGYNHLANVAVATFREKPSAHQPGSMDHSTQVACSEPSIISSQHNQQLEFGFHPLRASHYPLLKSAGVSPLGPECQIRDGISSSPDISSSSDCGWKYGNPMFGNVSPVGMHRSAIVCSPCTGSSSDFQNAFAFGDEETRAVMLWDLRTLTVVDRLKAHGSPILDVKSMNIGEHAILACTSITNLQVYKR